MKETETNTKIGINTEFTTFIENQNIKNHQKLDDLSTLSMLSGFYEIPIKPLSNDSSK